MSELSEKIVLISTSYLGPATRKFLQRQASGHMNGLNFDDLQKKDLVPFSKWVQISAALVIDSGKAKELAEKIAKL
jgi:hypothetical protein